eukprot:TRINITY_DN8047_c0_g1_i1.p1 TRINITY_DN8047_c0_g1~~TRINITY_DN8047_c0_g1_i1.p1  ORF type:complete len:725 (+),score=128.77 TRINITY_DN8047_c0_g1_i1:91-2265(+)
MSTSGETVGMLYLLTYGIHDFLEDEVDLPIDCSMYVILSAVLRRHRPEIEERNDQAGSCLNEMYNGFVSAPDCVRISGHAEDPRYMVGAVPLGLHDQLSRCTSVGCTALRFHLDVDQGRDPALEDPRRRLSHFLAHYNPVMLLAIDGMLQDARGFEENLMRALVARYGPEPEGDVDIRYRERLRAFYVHYNAEMLGQVDEILVQYRGLEEQLFTALTAKYGPEPILKGSTLGSEDSYTIVADSDDTELDPYPIPVPLMPLDQPLPDSLLPPPGDNDGAEADVHFWDNFVNQIPSGESGSGVCEGYDCQQALMRQFLRSWPVLCPHRVTVSCPRKEEVFRASKEFWHYLETRVNSYDTVVHLQEAEEEGGGRHVLMCASSLRPGRPPLRLTRRDWQSLVSDWHGAHRLERTVRVGSIAIDEFRTDPGRAVHGSASAWADAHRGRADDLCKPTPAANRAEQCIQTVAAAETQTSTPSGAAWCPVPAPEPAAKVDCATATDPLPKPRPLSLPAARPGPRTAVPALQTVVPRQLLRDRVPAEGGALAGAPPTRAGDAELEPCLVRALSAVRSGRRAAAAPASGADTASTTSEPPWLMESLTGTSPPPVPSRGPPLQALPVPEQGGSPPVPRQAAQRGAARAAAPAPGLHAAFALAEARLGASPARLGSDARSAYSDPAGPALPSAAPGPSRDGWRRVSPRRGAPPPSAEARYWDRFVRHLEGTDKRPI